MFNTVRSACALALLAAATQVAPAQETSTAAPVRARSILGAKVSIQGGTGVGTVEDIILSNDGVVDYLIVSDGGKLVTVPWEATKFNYEQRAATVNITQEQYRQIPTYTTQRYPNFYTPAYRTEVYRYYGLTPGQERRLDRRIDRPR